MGGEGVGSLLGVGERPPPAVAEVGVGQFVGDDVVGEVLGAGGEPRLEHDAAAAVAVRRRAGHPHGASLARDKVVEGDAEARVAEEIVLQTVSGSVEFARQSGKHMAELRNMVTSPGGTSAEAIYQMEKGGLRTVFSKSVYAAFQRTQTLAAAQEKE